MKRRNIITKLSALMLIISFAISVTPKSTFHALIANHTDGCFDNHQYEGQQLTKEGYNCHFENLVVESPYLWQPQLVSTSKTLFNTDYHSPLEVNFFSQYIFYSTLRGPPALKLFL